jgi:hypothetical protein
LGERLSVKTRHILLWAVRNPTLALQGLWLAYLLDCGALVVANEARAPVNVKPAGGWN